MKRGALILVVIAAMAGFSMRANAAIDLGTAGNFAVLAGSTVTNTGSTLIDGGDVGVSPGTAITGFFSVDGGPGIITPPYTTHSADTDAAQAQTDLTAAYNAAAGLAVTQDYSGTDLGTLILTPGVYFFSSSAQLTGTLQLDTQGDSNAQFVFQIVSTLTTASGSSVVMINGDVCTVYWQVGSSATLGTSTAFQGHILAQTSITLTTGATILNGSALAMDGAVTLDTNTINNNNCAVATIPSPTGVTAGLGGFGMLAVMIARLRQRFGGQPRA